jgi:HTH-type transcriptional regulator/antitoxin HigA
MSNKLADPAEMIRSGAPRLLRSDEELAEYTRTLFSLTSKAKVSAAEQEAIDLLSLLVEQYETTRYPLPEARAHEVLRLLMERNSVSEGKITPELGFQASASLIVLGKRQLNRGHIARLSKRFKVSPAVFFDETSIIALRPGVKKKNAAKKKAAEAKRAKGKKATAKS